MRLLPTLLILALPSLGQAVDGVTEINQASVLAAGGYPIVLSNSGSYRLTSDLEVPDPDVSVIQIAGVNITVDLNGFTIRGPNFCPGIPPVCNNSGVGEGVGRTGGTTNITVRNGRIQGMGSHCIDLENSSLIENVRMAHCGGDGIAVNSSAIVRDVSISAVGDDGVDVAFPGSASLVTGCTVDRAASFGLELGSNTGYSGNVISRSTSDVSGGVQLGDNLCGGVLCP